MLAAIPGYAHLRVYIPDEPDRNPDTSETDIDVLHQFAPLLQIALEVLSGLRPEHQIRTKRFGPAVRIHIGVQQRKARAEHNKGLSSTRLSGPVAVKSLHSRPSSTQPDSWELFGTALIGPANARSRYGFTAVCGNEQLVSLRVLAA